jgi:hypothetical protein
MAGKEPPSTSVEYRIAAERYRDDPAGVVRLAREKGMNDYSIVQAVVMNIPRDQRRAVAERLAPHLQMSVAQFMRIADARTT